MSLFHLVWSIAFFGEVLCFCFGLFYIASNVASWLHYHMFILSFLVSSVFAYLVVRACVVLVSCQSCAVMGQHVRDEHWTGLELVWIRTIANFVEFGLDPRCKSLQNLRSGPDLDWVNGKETLHFCCEKNNFSNFLDLFWSWTLHLKKFSECGWTWTEFFKIRTGSGWHNMTVHSSLQRVWCDFFSSRSFLNIRSWHILCYQVLMFSLGWAERLFPIALYHR